MTDADADKTEQSPRRLLWLSSLAVTLALPALADMSFGLTTPFHIAGNLVIACLYGSVFLGVYCLSKSWLSLGTNRKAAIAGTALSAIPFIVFALGFVPGPFMPAYSMDDVRLPDEVKQVLNNAESIELLSVEPESYLPDAIPSSERKTVGYYTVLGSITVEKHTTEWHQITDGLYRGIATNRQGYEDMCFLPRHGIRAEHGGNNVELVICFQCDSVRVYFNGSQREGCNTNDYARKLFNGLLRDAGIPLAP